MRHQHRFLFRYSYLLLLGLLGICIGCARTPGSIPVDESAAIEACETFLDAWREGMTPEDLKPRIHGSDYDWASGMKLISYEILPDEKSNGTSLEVSARLTLEDGRGVKKNSTAVYTVGTSPAVTVIRTDPL